MIKTKSLAFISFLLLSIFAVNAHAQLSDTDKQYIADLKKGDLRLLKRTAKLIINAPVRTPEVLDVVTEILLQGSGDLTKARVSTFTYLARALGESKNGRYYTALVSVEKTSNSKHVRKWAKKARRMIGKSNGNSTAQYTKGSVQLTTKTYL